jgi:hypothetical protein
MGNGLILRTARIHSTQPVIKLVASLVDDVVQVRRFGIAASERRKQRQEVFSIAVVQSNVPNDGIGVC